MKKVFLALLFIVTLPFAVSAQNTLMIGLKGGLNFSNLSGNSINADLLKSKSNFVGGAFLGINLGGIALQPEVIYVKKSTESSSANVSSTLDLTYFEVPILFKYYVPFLLIHPNLFAGPSFGFKTKATVSFNGVSVDVGDLYKNMDFGIVAGFGVDIPFGVISTLTIDIRYVKGLTSIGENDADIKTSGVQAFVGYGIGF